MKRSHKYKFNIPKLIIAEIKLNSKNLVYPILFQKCTHGKIQNTH